MEPAWLSLAYNELRVGIREIPDAQHHPKILAYHASTTLRATSDEIPWCSSFVCWCLERAGLNSTKSAAARSYLGWGVPVSVVFPPIGGIVVMRRGLDSPGPEERDAPGHVGFFWCHAGPGEMVILGGNQSNRVSLATYPVSRLLGIRWPGQEGP